MMTEKWKPRMSSIVIAATEGYSIDIFDPPLDKEQLETFYAYKELDEKLKKTGKPYTLEIPSEL